jgi:hypothetical protein
LQSGEEAGDAMAQSEVTVETDRFMLQGFEINPTIGIILISIYYFGWASYVTIEYKSRRI